VAAAASVCDSTSGNIVTNCGFESSNFSGWSVTGNLEGGIGGPNVGVNSANPNSGAYEAYFAAQRCGGSCLDTTSDPSLTPTVLSQAVPAQSNEFYEVSFYLDQAGQTPTAGGDVKNFFGASTTMGCGSGSQDLFEQENLPNSGGYDEYAFVVQAAPGSTAPDIEFAFTNDDPAGFYFDDVTVTSLGTTGPATCPGLSTALSAPSIYLGQSVTDTATVAGDSNGTPGGSVDFKVCGPLPSAETCDNKPETEVSTNPVSGSTGDNATAMSAAFTPTVAGTYCFETDYSPGNNSNYYAPAHNDTSDECFSAAAEPASQSQITRTNVTCAQVSGGSASTLRRVQYTASGGKVTGTQPASFDYWLTVNATGASQSLSTTQFTDETSRAFTVVASASAAYSGDCSPAPLTVHQSGSTVSFTFSGTSGAPQYIELRFSTTAIRGEAKPTPHATVQYLFRTRGVPDRQINLTT
jgi:hypothetical protein